VYLGFDPVRVEDMADDNSERIEALVDATERAVKTGDFVATPGTVCAGCAHRTHCAFAVVTA